MPQHLLAPPVARFVQQRGQGGLGAPTTACLPRLTIWVGETGSESLHDPDGLSPKLPSLWDDSGAGPDANWSAASAVSHPLKYSWAPWAVLPPCVWEASGGHGRKESLVLSPVLVPTVATLLQNGYDKAEGAGEVGACPEEGVGAGTGL